MSSRDAQGKETAAVIVGGADGRVLLLRQVLVHGEEAQTKGRKPPAAEAAAPQHREHRVAGLLFEPVKLRQHVLRKRTEAAPPSLVPSAASTKAVNAQDKSSGLYSLRPGSRFAEQRFRPGSASSSIGSGTPSMEE